MKTSIYQAIASALVVIVQTGQASAFLRGIRSDEPPFQQFEGRACRTSVGDSGSDGREFDLSWHVTRDECGTKCLDSPFKCYGWEYSDHSGRCEVWRVPIDDDELETVEGADCYIDKDELGLGDLANYDIDEIGDTDAEFGDESDVDMMGGIERGWSSTSYEKFEDRGCRTNYGRKGSAGKEYYLYEHVSKNTCKNRCIHLGSECYGWEYSASGKCEVWKVPIDEYKLAHVHDLDCYIKY